MGGDEGLAGDAPLFETKVGKGRFAYRVFAASMLVGICLIWVYRTTHIPSSEEPGRRCIWIGMFGAELWFGFYWIITQSVRWSPIYRSTFKERLSQRYEADLPTVDVFVCTADPTVEPPIMVICTVLSVMAYDYPSHKLAVYLSDDGGSDLTFYALLEASRFSKHWIPFCKEFEVEPRSPAAYFSSAYPPLDATSADKWLAVKRLYEEMAERIEAVVRLGRIPEGLKEEHKGFAEWYSGATRRDHHAIVQILIDGKCEDALDNGVLPTLVYMSREKRPQHHHNYKAGAMNALIRVSSEISNGSVILNVDCDMYSNNSSSVRDALCFFMDERSGEEIGYVQYTQMFENVTKNDLYANALKVVTRVELPGIDSFGGPLYMGTGCFHRRETLCGKKYDAGDRKSKMNSNDSIHKISKKSNLRTLEERAKALATSIFEQNTEWGKEVGLKYGCPVEDIVTGLAIQCSGWRSIFFYPDRPGFLGLAPTSLTQALVQHKRWSEGSFQIFLSKYCPFIYGHGKIKFGLQMGYCICGLWPANSIPTLYYVTVPSMCLLKGISLHPKMESAWFIPYAYVIVMKHAYSLFESLMSGVTFVAWWNIQRMWVLRRITSYLFGMLGVIWKVLGFSESAFVLTTKVAVDGEASKRYQQEVVEFGASLPVFTIIIVTTALINFLSLVGGLKKVMVCGVGEFLLQILLCAAIVAISVPIYNALFFRKDKGSIPNFIVYTSMTFAVLSCLLLSMF